MDMAATVITLERDLLKLYQYQSKEPLSTPYMSQNHTKLLYHVLSQYHNPTRFTQSNKLLKPQSSTRRLSPFNNPLYTPLSNKLSKLTLPQLLPSLPQLLPSLPQPSESPDTPELPSEPDTVLLLLPQLAPSPLPHLLLDTDLPLLPQLSLDTDSGLLTNKQLIQNENTIL